MGGGVGSPSFSLGGRFKATLPVNWIVIPSGESLDGVEGLFTNVVSLQKHLGLSCSVPQVDETDGALAALASMKPMTVTSLSSSSAPLSCSS